MKRPGSATALFAPSRILKISALVTAFAALATAGHAQIGGSNWTAQTPDFKVQSPYNLPVSDRYAYDSTTGIYHLWVFSTDEPFQQGNATLPRTEQRFEPDYTSGEIQYQAMLMGDPSENSYCIFQIHTGDAQSTEYGSTTFMLFWFSADGGSVWDYSGTELVKNLGSNWFQLNADHNLATNTITIWINGQEIWEQKDNGAGDFYFKDGVYEQNHSPTNEMDAWVENLQFWTSPGTGGSPGFTLSPSLPSMTVQAGASAKTTITVAPANGFN
ncbi:MAG: polysaccharide lyase family 7 protein, partial [Terracidiphilus sp.]